ncbi:MAG: diguanylate cyclase (GGDEF)-like protein [Planctomycetota bacterium]|jgi:diguanylate cyclase (GGDEF)-like protein
MSLWRMKLARRYRVWRESISVSIEPQRTRLNQRTARFVKASRDRLMRITLGTRIFMVLVSMAAATSLIITVLQDNSLSADLQRSARTRLEWTSKTASQLLNEHLAEQYDRYEASSKESQFIANLESNDAPTLTHYSKVVADRYNASVILFIGSTGSEVAFHGDQELRDLVKSRLEGVAPEIAVPGGTGATTSPLVLLRGAPYSMVNVPLYGEIDLLGSLIAVEPIRIEKMATWSRLCRGRVTVDDGPLGNQLSMPFRSVDDLAFRVAISYEDERAALANSRQNALVGGMVGLALATLVSFLLARSLVKPIHAIQSATERIANGDLGFRLDTRRSDEVGDVSRGFNLMLERLDQNIRERVRVEDQISHLAYHDSLTGLANRRLMKERLEIALKDSKEFENRVAVMFMDLDRFKDVNDSLGHSAGDELLMEVSNRINGALVSMGFGGREGDSPALLARLGGDEFTVLLGDIEDREQVETLSKRILRSLMAPFQLRGQEVSLSASIGTALAPNDADDAESLLRFSDMAMFHAKKHGGRRHEFYSDSMQELATKRLVLESKIQAALENEEFELYYQPKLNLDTGQADCAEALLRWNDPDRGLVGPAEFISMAEETGAIIQIGDWVLREAVRQSVEWREAGVPPVRIAVNVSARQLESGGDFARTVADLIDESGLDPALLDLEITESAMLKDEEAVITLLQKLRKLGVGLALDDFGTGYSSLSYLRKLPINTLKIDRSFIIGVETVREEAAMVESILSMAQNLNLRVVAEGVETRKQQKFLDDLGCDEIQGYIFSEPLRAAEAAEFLSRKRRRRSPRKVRPELSHPSGEADAA